MNAQHFSTNMIRVTTKQDYLSTKNAIFDDKSDLEMKENTCKRGWKTAFGACFGLFLLATLVNLFSRVSDVRILELLSKPLLMSSLAMTIFCLFKAAGFKSTDGHPCRRRTLILALVFGCIGDILLMFDGTLTFLAGMGSFLVGHVFYYCTLPCPWKKGRSAKEYVLSLLLLIALLAGLTFVSTAFGIPGMMGTCVSIYACCFAFLIHACIIAAIDEKSRFYAFAAVAFFIFAISDCLVAVGVFTDLKIPMRGFIVMLTYIFAQAVIAFSLAAQEGESVKAKD